METLFDDNSQRPLRILLFSASLRNGSLNTKLIDLAAKHIEKSGAIVDLGSMEEFECPSFDADVDINIAPPPGAVELRKRILDSDAFIIASPEFNASMPGNLKNILDWVSRFRPQPFNERNALLMAASPSMVGGNRGLWALRIPLEHLGCRVYPDMFSLAMAHQAFTPDGNLSNEVLARRFEATLTTFVSYVEAAIHYPCMKKAWVEFLGEKPDPVTERVE